MKLFPLYLLFISATLSLMSCKKFLDVNKDPNNPVDVSAALILAPVEVQIATNITAGNYSLQNLNGPALITSYFLQELSINQPQPQVDGYKLAQDDVDPIWLTMYSGILQNLRILNNKAEENGNHAYGVIAKVLTAYSLGITTDLWGDIPFDDAFDGKFKPAYESQEDIYKKIQQLLDSAILERDLDPGVALPSSDDYLYDGDIDKWVKFAYTLKARYYMHLTNAPGYDAAEQSSLALTALENGFQSQDDEAEFSVYSDNPASENPWYMNTGEDQGGVVLGKSFIDSLKVRNDPRLPVIATNPNGVFLGRIGTTDPDPDPTVFSVINDYYAGIDAPLPIVNYSEALFLKAEATFRVSGAAAATPFYVDAIKSHMSKLGIDVNSSAAAAYISSRGTLTTANAIQRIMEEKSIANFLSLENYNDWRRTGFPTLEIVPNPFIANIPVRFPYPLAEVTSNAQPQHTLTIRDRVWWDGD